MPIAPRHPDSELGQRHFVPLPETLVQWDLGLRNCRKVQRSGPANLYQPPLRGKHAVSAAGKELLAIELLRLPALTVAGGQAA
jgi:hypothetical protein